jgi:Holliday junction resolvasome RuvABC endonuclease subunit
MITGRLKILSINPGSRYLGMAILDGTELCDWAVRVVKGKDIREKRRFIRELISGQSNRYGVSVLAIKKAHPSRSSAALRHIVSEAKSLAVKQNLTLREFSIDEVKTHLLSAGRGNKRQLMEEVAARYPFLFREVQREEKNKNPYLIRMFEAVGMGIVCFNQLDSGNAKVAKANK